MTQGTLDVDTIQGLIQRGDVDTILMVFPDQQGRFMGKRVTGDFFVNDVETLEPYVKPEQFADSITELAKQNPGVKNYDISKAIDNSFVKSALDRGLAK